MPASESEFGDPCPTTHKYLEAHYMCVRGELSGDTVRGRVTSYHGVVGLPVTMARSGYWSGLQTERGVGSGSAWFAYLSLGAGRRRDPTAVTERLTAPVTPDL